MEQVTKAIRMEKWIQVLLEQALRMKDLRLPNTPEAAVSLGAVQPGK
jgi:hypothetical protein